MTRTCFIEDCQQPHEARGMCHRHYSQWRKTGNALPAPRVAKVCEIDGCDRAHYARGWCGAHYTRWLRTGDPLPSTEPPELDLFLENVKVTGSGCWEWQGSRDPRPNASYGRWRGRGAHRAAWELHHGPIPDNMYVCHTCDNPPCVNVAHLFLGTQEENMQDMVRKGRRRH